MNSLDKLSRLGFAPCGVWQLDGGQLQPALQTVPTGDHVLYAFVCGTEVLYLGKTIRGVANRMRGYRHPGPSQSTNIRVNARIREHLDNGHEVAIHAWACDGLLTYGGFGVNLAAGLEGAIIRELSPAWNMRKS